MEQASSPDLCVSLARAAGQLGSQALYIKCLHKALGLDRHCTSAALLLAADAHKRRDTASAFILLQESERAGLLPGNARPLLDSLTERANRTEGLKDYLRLIGKVRRERAARPLSIVLVTNLFPPQELGGYGRMMWEFAHGLMARGHRVRILTSATSDFGHYPATEEENEMEVHVARTLELTGSWAGGRPELLGDRNELARRMRDNAARLRSAVSKTGADLVLAGNIDFLGMPILRPAFEKDVPVLHALANEFPGYEAKDLPADARYWVAPCSDWNGMALRKAGFTPARIETLYPGARVDRFFKYFLPDTARLRICYASLVLPYKGADTLVHALGRLHARGIDFTAEIAGDAPDGSFRGALGEFVRAQGMESKVRLSGFLDRRELVALFARSNTLVFPSRFQEPFGISQVEALASGLVVVSSGTGGAREIIRDNIDGLLFTAGSDSELAERLARLISEPGLMPRLQRQAQARATQFTVDRAVAKIESLACELRAALPWGGHKSP